MLYVVKTEIPFLIEKVINSKSSKIVTGPDPKPFIVPTCVSTRFDQVMHSRYICIAMTTLLR